MSSILKALKRVEDVQPEPRRTESWSHTFDSREAIRKQARRSRTVRTGLAALCVILVLGLGGWWVYDQAPRSGEDPEAPVETAVTGSGAGGTAVRTGPEERAPAPPEPPPARAAAQRPPGRAAPPVSQPVSSPAAAPALLSSPPPKPSEPARASGQATVPRTASGAPSAPAVSAPREAAEPLDTSRLKLEAIVWSSNPESRFAVINGSILRPGGTVDGLTLTDIERNGVKLRSGNRAGEIRFPLD